MEKVHAIEIFGSGVALAKALGICKSAISQWPETLTTRQQDEVIGAAIRLNKLTPQKAKELIEHERERNQRASGADQRPNRESFELEGRHES